jgi:hypothetical protein
MNNNLYQFFIPLHLNKFICVHLCASVLTNSSPQGRRERVPTQKRTALTPLSFLSVFICVHLWLTNSSPLSLLRRGVGGEVFYIRLNPDD